MQNKIFALDNWSPDKLNIDNCYLDKLDNYQAIKFIKKHHELFYCIVYAPKTLKDRMDAHQITSTPLIDAIKDALQQSNDSVWMSLAQFREAIYHCCHDDNAFIISYFDRNPAMREALIYNDNDPLIWVFYDPSKLKIDQTQIANPVLTHALAPGCEPIIAEHGWINKLSLFSSSLISNACLLIELLDDDKDQTIPLNKPTL